MTSEARDAALLGGEPLKLYRITRGALHWFYTNADAPVVYGGDTYTPTAIEHDKITDGGEQQKRTINITLPKSLSVADNWRPYPPGDPIGITIWTLHSGETDYLVDWIGRLLAPVFNDTKLTLTSEASQSRNKRGGRSGCWQRGCPLVLFYCGVNKADQALPATLTVVTGLTLTATEFGTLPSGRLNGGWIEWTRADSLLERRSINAHVGSTITVLYGAADLASGLSVTAYPGCRGTYADCSYYENTDNFGGELYIPGRDFYDGNPVR